MRNKLLPIVVATTVAVIAIGAGAWWLTRGEQRGPPGPPLADVYASIAAALSRPGMVAHVSFEADASNPWISGTREAWLDLPNDVAREQTTTSYRSPSVTATRQSGVIYRRDAKLGVAEGGQQYRLPIEGCAEALKRVLTLFNSCPRPNGSKIEMRTEIDRHFGATRAIVAVTEGSYSGTDSTIEVHDVLFVDAATYLPLALEIKGTDRYALGGLEQAFHTTTRYRIDFVTRESLSPGFFEPTSIGYVALEPEQILDTSRATFPLYWLGSDYAGEGVVPPLILSDVRVVESGQGDLGPSVTLTYARADDEFAELVSVSQMSAGHARFNAATGGEPEWRRDPCATHREVLVPGAHAAIYQWRVGAVAYSEQPCSDSDTLAMALEVDFGDTIVTVAPSYYRALNRLPNPYEGEAAVQSLGLALRRRK